ncbi:MAG: hypothetical protein ACYTXA_01910 [Nostoc sp.]
MVASNTEVSFFHPRQNKWSENFQLDTQSGKIIGITSSGKVTSLRSEFKIQNDARGLALRGANKIQN